MQYGNTLLDLPRINSQQCICIYLQNARMSYVLLQYEHIKVTNTAIKRCDVMMQWTVVTFCYVVTLCSGASCTRAAQGETQHDLTFLARPADCVTRFEMPL